MVQSKNPSQVQPKQFQLQSETRDLLMKTVDDWMKENERLTYKTVRTAPTTRISLDFIDVNVPRNEIPAAEAALQTYQGSDRNVIENSGYDYNDTIVESVPITEKQCFETRDLLIDVVKKFYESKHVFLKMGRSTDDKKVTLQCLSGGKYKAKGTGCRKTTTRLTDCPFRIIARFGQKRNKWKISKINDLHNHDLSNGYAENRRLSSAEKKEITQMATDGISRKEILSSLRSKYGNYHSTAKDVANVIDRYRTESLAGRSPIEALHDSLTSEDFIFEVKTAETGNVRGLFLVHPESVQLARRFSDVFIMDYTYKTNRYGMPLLNIVGITATYHTFNAGFAFLSREDDAEYTWALQALQKVTTPKVVVTEIRALAETKANTGISLQSISQQWHLYLETDADPVPVAISPRKETLLRASERLYENDDTYTFQLLVNRVQDALDIPQTKQLNPTPMTHKRGRPSGSKNKSTKRDLSHFEIVERRERGNSKLSEFENSVCRKCENSERRKCGDCKNIGHNRKTCEM
jgi:hypothetical protein